MKSLKAGIYLFSVVLLLSISFRGWAQKPLNPVTPVDSSSLVEVLYAEVQEGVNLKDMQTQTFTGNVRFRHQGVLMGTQKAIQNTTANTMQAFGKIVINQGDTLTIVGDTLFYDGHTRIATIWGKKVILRDKKVTLTTQKVIYNIPENMAFYPVKGEITQDSSLLSSNTGYYNTQTKYFNYIGDVQITNPDFVLCTDLMDYDTYTQHAIFKAPTTITGEDGELVAEKGWYNIKTKESYFTGASRIENQDYFLSGDTLSYNSTTDSGVGFGNIFYISKKDSLVTAGNSLFRNGETGLTKILGETITKIFSSTDTSYLVADSLIIQEIIPVEEVRQDSTDLDTTVIVDIGSTGDSTLLHPQIKETDTVLPDSSRKNSLSRESLSHVIAFGNVQVLRDDFQSKSDSLVYNKLDSTIRYYGNPILWFKRNQMKADSVNIYLENDKIRRLEMIKNGFVIQEDTIGNYNQLKGREINAYFNEKTEIESIQIYGNAESKFFVLDDNQRIVGLNLQQSSRMTFLFSEGELEYIKAYTDVDEETIPPNEMTQGKARFPDFSYKIGEKLSIEKLTDLKYGSKVIEAFLKEKSEVTAIDEESENK